MASGRINGSCTGTAASKYNLWVEWTSTPDVANDRSLVTATEYLQRNDGWLDSAWNYDAAQSDKKITINGSTKTASAKGIDTRNNVKLVVVSHSAYVYHGTSGNVTVNISATIPYVVSQLSGGSVSGRITLEDISPLKITEFNVSDVAQTSARLNYTVTGGTVAVAEYSVNGGSTWATIPSGNVVTGLSPNTDYNFVIRVKKSTNGNVTTSNVITQKTLPIYVTDFTVPNELVIDVDESVEVQASDFEPENASIKDIIFEADGDIVAIDGLRIIGKNKGTAIVTARTIDGGGVEKTINISVYSAVSGVTINPQSLSIKKGTSFSIPYQVLPIDADNKEVNITSSNTDVITISGSTANAIDNGRAVIMVNTVDGGFTAEMTVDVVDDYTWFEYNEPLEILNTEDIAHIESNMQTIATMFAVSGRQIDIELLAVQKNTAFINMFDILQKIEYNLDELNSSDIVSLYYREPFMVGENAENREDIWRWIQILEDLKSILSGKFGKWQRLKCSDGYPTINGNTLIVEGEIING